MKRLAEFFQDGDGALSSVRLAFIAWCLGSLGVWAWTSVKAGAMQEIPEGLSWFLLVIGGIKGLEAVPSKKQ